jgi:hypothetical protein
MTGEDDCDALADIISIFSDCDLTNLNTCLELAIIHSKCSAMGVIAFYVKN